jgi:diacylglycerol kinase family enzyme
MKKYVLYNPLSCNCRGEEQAKKLNGILEGETLEFIDVTKTDGYDSIFSRVTAEDEIVICGGDGTLNVFANAVKKAGISNKLYYYACGSGNDFLRDVEHNEKPLRLNAYLEDLPTVTVNAFGST